LLSTGTSQPFRRAKSLSRFLHLITKGDRKRAVGSIHCVGEDQHLPVPIGGSRESHIERLAIHGDAEMNGNHRLAMLDLDKAALNNRSDDGAEYRRSNVQGPFAREIRF